MLSELASLTRATNMAVEVSVQPEPTMQVTASGGRLEWLVRCAPPVGARLSWIEQTPRLRNRQRES